MTTTASILVVHTVGKKSAMAQPAPNATKSKFLLTHGFIVSPSPVLLYTMKLAANRYSRLKEGSPSPLLRWRSLLLHNC